MTMTAHYAESSKLSSRSSRTSRRAKIARWVKFTYRLYYKDGSSRYLSKSIAQLEGQTREDTVKYLVNDFTKLMEYSEGLIKVKLISVDGEKVNIVIE